MKSLFSIVYACSAFMAFCQPGNSETLQKEGLKVYELQEATVTYAVTEGGDGNVTFSFDRSGLRSVTITKIAYAMYGIDAEMSEVDIRDGSDRFIYDLTRNTGRKKQQKTEIDLLRYKSIKETRESIYAVNGGQLVDTDVILGKETEHWTFTSGPIREAWYWQGIILRASIKRPRLSYTYEAIKLETKATEIIYPDINIAAN